MMFFFGQASLESVAACREVSFDPFDWIAAFRHPWLKHALEFLEGVLQLAPEAAAAPQKTNATSGGGSAAAETTATRRKGASPAKRSPPSGGGKRSVTSSWPR